MTLEDSPFQLSEPWFTLGVVTPARLVAMRAEWAMNTIVRLPECPDIVLDAAAASGLRHLTRLVERRRLRDAAADPHPDSAE